MNPAQRREAARYLKAFDFSGLFTDPSIGWDWPESGKALKVPTGQGFRELQVIAEKKGVKVLLVPPLADGSIMPSDERKKLEVAVTPLAAEHLLIFADKAKTRQVWLWTSRLPGKPIRRRELNWEKGRSNELLLQKVISIAFTLDEEEALDITGVVHRLHDNLDRDRLTKRFYDEFKKHKDRFQKFIAGLSDQGVMAHYTSLMLNRLMFCYFLQQKGFLDGDQNYLRTRFETVRTTLGKDKFHSFYITFLKRLFHDGLDSSARPDELTAIIGKNIPYLNGGIFAEHKIEKDNPGIQIPDEAFAKIFTFFDSYDWHLDDRPLANGNEINPEVLGYVFEKYTNQKEMGAYYTKEDITGYISQNTILPFLLQKVGAKLPAAVWDLLKNDPDRYIYKPVRRGAGDDEKEWKKSLPKNIATGLDPKAPDLLERRKDWNTTAPASHGLPTEIWRETIARHQRCHDLRKKLRAGEVKEAADLVTLNLDIRQFVQDVIATAPADLALALWKALRALSVLDPTCGSGAFLFAALEILEPLYEGLLERLRALLSDWRDSGEKHPKWEPEINAILALVDRHPNEAYFIHKTIIVHNLYGVDIMEEAVEICKLRLFLKLAAQLEPGQAIEPLPDIDFNVRSGNTLVGYASRAEIQRAFAEAGGSGQMMLQGIETSLDDFRRIMEGAEDADRLFQQFQHQQDLGTEGASAQLAAKQKLGDKLDVLRLELDQFLAAQYDQRNTKTDAAFRKWKASHEPFHWFIEFYGIMNSGGFDVIVGNPPYVPAKGIGYTIQNPHRFPDIYALVILKSLALAAPTGLAGMIIPMSLAFSSDFGALRSELQKSGSNWISSYDNIPAALFTGVSQRCTIWIGNRQGKKLFSAPMVRWRSSSRETLFPTMTYVNTNGNWKGTAAIPKVYSEDLMAVLRKIECPEENPKRTILSPGKSKSTGVGFSPSARNFVSAFITAPPCLDITSYSRLPSSDPCFTIVESEAAAKAAFVSLAGDFYFLFWLMVGDGFHVTQWMVKEFLSCLNQIPETHFTHLSELGAILNDHRNHCLVFKKNAGKYVGNYNYKPCGNVTRRADLLVMAGLGCSKEHAFAVFERVTRILAINPSAGEKGIPSGLRAKFSPRTIDTAAQSRVFGKIDTILAEHYGFTPGELDFIVNQDIKLRNVLPNGSADGSEDDDE